LEHKRLPCGGKDIPEFTLELDLRKVPFSRKGSYLAISWLDPSTSGPITKEGLYLRHLRAGGKGPVFLLEPVTGTEPIPYTICATPTVLRLLPENNDTTGWFIEFCFPSPDELRFRISGSDLGLRFTTLTGSYDHITPICIYTHDPTRGGLKVRKPALEVNSYTRDAKFLFVPAIGELRVDAPWNGVECEYIQVCFGTIDSEDSRPVSEGLIQDYKVVREPMGDVQTLSHGEHDCLEVLSWTESLEKVKEDFNAWRKHCPSIESHPDLLLGHELASYITWSCVVRKEGFLPGNAMYMSKNWMANVWSWDHCFNSMALFYEAPSLAWEQFCLFFHRQHRSGVLPDYMNDKSASWNCCKPPIHGWALRWMIERDDSGFLDQERLSRIYRPLARWTEWWFSHRDYDRDGIPQYNHGNESGWDNSTVFAETVPVESPDLCAFLVVQMEVLSYISMKLGKEAESKTWLAKSRTLLERMIEHYWSEECLRPVSLKLEGTTWEHRYVRSDSLLPYVSIVLGKNLPEEVQKWIVSELKQPGPFLTPYGLATEKTTSPYYEPAGYWRGPVWAPSTMLIVDGLGRIGETRLAREIAQRFCHTAASHGMAENFDALTGEALEDPAFTWTSSVYMILAHEYI